jgi:hypothetical protein
MLTLGRVVGLLFLFTLLSFGAGVEATVSSQQVVRGSTVELSIVAEGERIELPAIHTIGNAPVLSSSKSKQHSLSFVNGKSSNKTFTTLRYTFSPQESMVIPSYTVTVDGQTYTTKPIDIVVEAPSTNPTQIQKQGSDFSIWMDVDKKSVLLDESFVLTFYFSQRSHVRVARNPQYTPPHMDDFYVKQLEQVPAYQKGGQRIEEIRYLVTPKKVGKFTIHPARLKIGLEDHSQRDIFGMFFNTKWKELVTNSLTIEVKPQPVEADVYGNFKVEATIDTKETNANKPVNVTFKISGEGALEDFVPPEYEIDGVTMYSDDAKVDSRVVNGTLQSSYTKSYAFIADESFTIPKHEIKQYNPKTKETTLLHVPAFTVSIKQHKKSKAKVTQSVTSTPKVLDEGQQNRTESNVTTVIDKGMLALAFLLGIVTTLLIGILYFGLKRRKEAHHLERQDALQKLYPHIDKDEAIEKMVRDLYAKKRGENVTIDKKVLKEMLKRIETAK